MNRPEDKIIPMRLKSAFQESHTDRSKLHMLVKLMARRAAEADLAREAAQARALPPGNKKR